MQKAPKRVLALVLALIMALSVFSISASAESANYNPNYQSETHTVFKHTAETLAPGIEYYNNYAYAKDGKQMVYYVTTADVSRDDVVFQIAYKDMQCENYGMAKLTDMVDVANAKYSDPDNPAFISENYAVVSGTNGNGYNMTTGQPSGAWAMGGVIAQDYTGGTAFMAQLKDGRAVMGKTVAEWNAYKADPGIKEAINAFGTILVWDGADVTNSSNTTRASRTMLGITEDGKVVTAVLDGRQVPFSCGGSYHELAQIMLEAGCKYAVNLDGGGSTTFVNRAPGDNDVKIVNRPSDGSERSISNGIIIATTAKVKDEAASISFTPETEYVTPGTSVKIPYATYDDEGSPVSNPAKFSIEASAGTYENGVFTAPAAEGDVTITAKTDGETIGTQVIHVVIPDTIQFNEYEAFYERLGTSTPISFTAKKGGNEVTVKPEDFDLVVYNNEIDHQTEVLGSFDGYIYNAPADTAENQALVSGTLTATVKGTDVSASNLVKFTDTYVLTHDFETTGRGGDPEEAYSQTVDPNRCWSSYATAETGKVHSGNRSLAITCDFTNNDTINYNTGYMAVQQKLGSFANCSYAKTVGMWIWIPESIGTLWVRLLSTNGNIANLIDTGELYQDKYENGAWHYFAADVSGKQAFTANEIEFYVSDRDGVDYGYYFKDQTDVNKRFTIYIDDIGFDRTYGGYDFEDPIVGAVTAYTASGTPGVELGYKQISDIGASTISLTADVYDDFETNPYTVSGLDYSTAEAYIDGVKVNAKAANNTINIEDVTLSKGVHTVRFAIKDKAGCETVISRQFNIAAGSNSALKLVSEKNVSEKALIGSVRWFDLVADDISTIDSADVVLDLDSFSKWQRMLIETADGFTSTSSVDDEFNTLTLHFERTSGTPESNVLARIPVKAWQHTGTDDDARALFADQDFFPTSILVNTVKGVVTLSGGATDTFSSAEIRIDTEIDGNYAKLLEEGYFADGKTCWHLHTVEWIEEPADGTDCLHPSHGGKGYCTVCEEVVYNDDAPGFGIHHYDWDVDGQQYVCKDCGATTTEAPTMSSGKVSFSDGSQINTGWVITGGGNYYFEDGVRLTGFAELPAVDGSGTFMYNLTTGGTVLTGTAYGTEGNKVYENGILAKGRIVESGSSRWAADADGNNVFDGNAAALMEYEGNTYAVTTTTNQNFGKIIGLWSGPANYASNTNATTDTYYLHGQVIPGWKSTSGVAYDENGTKVTGWRNADGSVANVDITDESTIIGKYYFGTTGKLATGDTEIKGSTTAGNRYINFATKAQTDPLVCTGYSTNPYKKVSNVIYVYGLPQTTDYFQTAASYTYMFVNGTKVTASASETEPKLFVDGYYYGIKGGNVQSAYRPDVIFSGSNGTRNLGMKPYWIEARYTGVIDDGDNQGYAIYGQLYEGYTFDDNRVIDNNGDPINAWFVNGFGDNVYYQNGRLVTSGQFIVDGKAYTVADEYGKAVPYNGIFDGKFYIDGIEATNEVYDGQYVVSNNKVCYVNEDGSIGDPVNGIIGESFFVDGVANDLTIIDGRLINIDGKLYYLEDGVKGDAFTGLLNGVYYEDGSATEYTVINGAIVVKEGKYYTVADDGSLVPFYGLLDGVYYENGSATDYEVIEGKYVFKDGILYNIGTNGSLAGRVSATVDGTKYTSGKPMSGWVADTYYYKDGKALTGVQLIDGVYYTFDDEGVYQGKYNGMLYDENADVYRMYDQGERIDGATEFGTCVDGVPVDGWYAREYYFVNGKYLTGIQQVDGYYYDFGDDGKGNYFVKYTGLFFDEADGVYRYSKLGELASGWIQIDDEWYYFRESTMAAAVGRKRDSATNVRYEFDVTGKLLHGEWVADEEGTRYYYGPSYYHASGTSNVKWVEIDGNTYGFDKPGHRYEGVCLIREANSYVGVWYNFSNEGVRGGLYTTEGLFEYQGNLYYIKNDGTSAIGLVLVDGKYYYFTSHDYLAIKGQTYWASVTNDLLPAAYYDFGDDGAIIFPDEPEVKNGIIDGYYYVDDVKTYAGLFKYTDGKYYYANSKGLIITGAKANAEGKYWVSKTNDIVPAAYYAVDENGVFTIPEQQPVVNEGIVDGYYYVNGEKTYAGLFQYTDGNYYYANSKGLIITSAKANAEGKYWVTKTNDIVPAAYYTVDENGVFDIAPDEPETLNGIVDGYYYVDGVKTYAGLFQYTDGKYYYANSKGLIITSAKANAEGKYWITKTNDIVPAGYYTVDENGVFTFT